MKKNKFIQLLCTALFSISVYASSHANTVVIDNVRSLNVNNNTVLKIDGRDVPKPSATEQYGTGFLSQTLPGFKAKVSYLAGTNSSAGDLSEINLMNSVIGPVTASSASSLQILLIDLAIDADTIIEGVASIEDIAVGSIVAASGIESETGAILATRIEVLLHNSSSYWLMTGNVANLNASGFNIGAQHFNFVINQDNLICETGAFDNGEKVIVEILPANDYNAGDAVNAVMVTCYDDFISPIEPPAYVFFSDFINNISVDKTQITVGSTVVNLLIDTQIVGGNIDSLAVGIQVQVEGVVDSQTNEVDATYISLPVKLISAQAPIIASDVTLSDTGASNGKVMVMGIEVNQNELTMDPGALFINGLGGYEGVAISAYEDDAGKVWASFVAPFMIETTPNGTTTFYIEGSVTNVTSDQLEVMGVNIGNLSNAAFFNIDRELITATEFLNALSNGDSVAVSDAANYDRASNTLYAGSLFLLEQTPQPLQQKVNVLSGTAASNNVSGLGIVTEFVEDGLIFRAGFE